MELTPEEQERKQAIQRFMEGERPVDIYRENRSKTWFKKWSNRYQTGQKERIKSILERLVMKVGICWLFAELSGYGGARTYDS